MSLGDKLQRILGINRREAAAVTAIVGFLTLGALYNWLSSPEPAPLPSHLQQLLDSLSTAQYAALQSPLPADGASASDSLPKLQPQHRKAPAAPVNLNTATKAELMSLPGIGPVLADRILEYRRSKRFEAPEELLEVKGIGPKKFERLRPYIRVE